MKLEKNELVKSTRTAYGEVLQEIGEEFPDVVVMDEPELGLHPYTLTLLAGLVRSVAVDHQVIISTQSVELLNEFNVDEVLVADRDGEGTRLKRLNEEELRVWLEDGYSLGELWQKNLLGGRLSR